MDKSVEQALQRIQANPQFTKDVALVYTEIPSIKQRYSETLALLVEVEKVIASDDLRARKALRRKVLRVTQDLHTLS